MSKKIKRIKEVLNILDLKQILDILIFPIIAIISLISKPFLNNEIWLIEENPYEACDNGYIFFKYIRENQKDINAYYVINKKSKDYEKVINLGNVIHHRSLKHWIYYLNASKIIITQKYSNPSPALFYFLHINEIIKIPRFFLQHGITKDDAKMFYYNRTKFELFICGAKREYEYVKQKFGYPNNNVVYTGFPRFDNLKIANSSKDRTILIAPTWRKWIHSQKDFDLFIKNYYDLLNSKNLIDYIDKNNISIIVVLHKNMRKFKLPKNNFNKNIQIKHNKEVNIQELINKISLFITDYSSIFFDVAYIKRPIIFYQFDEKQYREQQLQEGYFSYKNDGFGEICQDSESVIDKIKYYAENNFNIEEVYNARMDKFFERKDDNNCKRVFEKIKKDGFK